MTRTINTDLINAVNAEKWMADARCAGDPEPDNWFGGIAADRESAQAATKRIQTAHDKAKALCAECPVAQLCFDRALGVEGEAREHYGIFGGVDFGGTYKSRRDLARSRRSFVRAHTRVTWETRQAAREAWAEIVEAS